MYLSPNEQIARVAAVAYLRSNMYTIFEKKEKIAERINFFEKNYGHHHIKSFNSYIKIVEILVSVMKMKEEELKDACLKLKQLNT